jgi:beta-lactamase regulating signal transducer with metallopeptidase domain
MIGWAHAAAVARSAVEGAALVGLQATALAIAALVVVRAGRLRPGWQAGVWLIVLAKFVLPWGPALPWSFADLIAALRHAGDAPVVIAPALGGVGEAPAASGGWLVVAALWLAGAAAVLARTIAAQRRVVRAARRAPEAPAEARALLAGLCGRRRSPRLVVGAASVGPHVVGIARPIIVVPAALLGDAALLRAALLHELAHVRRLDAVARLVQVAAGAVYFFWPVVRLVSRRLELAREAACDAWAIEASGVARPLYARLLVQMARLRSVAPAGASLAARRGLDARVAAVLAEPSRARLGVGHRLGLVAWAAMALGGARSAAARDPQACRYTPALAEALRAAHPEADLDGDGVLSRDEACEFQAELRRRVEASDGGERVSRLDPLDEDLLTEPLCCNCDRGGENSAPWLEPSSDVCPLR